MTSSMTSPFCEKVLMKCEEEDCDSFEKSLLHKISSISLPPSQSERNVSMVTKFEKHMKYIGTNGVLSSIRCAKGKSMFEAVFSSHSHPEVKLHVVWAYLYLLLPIKEIAYAFGKKISTVRSWIKKFIEAKEKFGEEFAALALHRQKNPTKVTRKLTCAHYSWVAAYIRKRPLSYLREVRDAFKKMFFSISTTTIFQMLIHLGFTRRVIERRAIQIKRHEVLRYAKEINQVQPLHHQLLFIDEMSCQRQHMLRTHGWFKRRESPFVRGAFHRTERLSTLCFLGK